MILFVSLVFNYLDMMDDYYTKYYFNQTGGGGGDSNHLDDHFLQLKLPHIYQRGQGVGSIFNSLWKFLQPLLRKGASFASKQLLETGADVITGIAEQKPIKSILADRSIQIVDKLRDKAAEKIKSMSGSGSKRKRKHDVIKTQSMKKQCQFVSRRPPVKNKKKINKNSKNKYRVLDIFS